MSLRLKELVVAKVIATMSTRYKSVIRFNSDKIKNCYF